MAQRDMARVGLTYIAWRELDKADLCKRWKTFRLFLKDMGNRPSERHALVRIDVNGPYSAKNCRWEDTRKRGGRTPIPKMVGFYEGAMRIAGRRPE